MAQPTRFFSADPKFFMQVKKKSYRPYRKRVLELRVDNDDKDNSCINYALSRTGKNGGQCSSRSNASAKKCHHSEPKQEIKLTDHNKTAESIFADMHGHATTG